jgi:putative transposase
LRLVESHIISKNNLHWKECDRICFLSKNLYNQALYRVIKHYEETGLYKNYNSLVKELASEKQIDFTSLNTKVSQQTLMILDKNMKSFFKSLSEYKKCPSKFTGSPQLPKFKHKKKGRNIVVFTNQAISSKELKKGYAKLSSSLISIKTDKDVQQVRITPLTTRQYKIEIIYLKDEPALVINKIYAGIDLGLNNLATVVINDNSSPFIINGKPLKSINQYYNKKLAKLKSELPKILRKGEKKQKSTSKKINKLTHKRNCKINDYMHKSSKILVDILKQNNVSKVVIGQNKQWKTEINIGRKNNQKFVSIPHSKYIQMLEYKLKLVGVETICREESYTSKCSFLDNEPIKKHDVYLGIRIKRGLFRSSKKIKINADVNGSANILKKEIPTAFDGYGIEGVVVHPIRIKSYETKMLHRNTFLCNV